ncbi:MAG: UbiA family prenyltransferase, partial [Dongiaceae bacterium]
GRARFQRDLAGQVAQDVANLPYDEDVVGRIRAAKADGRAVYLASALGESFAGRVAAHLSLFDGWFASDDGNESADMRAVRLVGLFGDKGFDYIGSGKDELPVWRHAATAVAIRTPESVVRTLRSSSGAVEQIEPHHNKLRSWIHLLRPHQWLKNSLVAVPLLIGHNFLLITVMETLLAFVAFSICASSVYIVNDLVDVQADRAHPTKRTRPFASGELSVIAGALLAIALVVFAFALAAVISPAFLGMLAIYFATASAYSFYLKRKMLIDVVTLAGLYTLRVVAGAVAGNLEVSQWILAFSMYLFLALALIKRHAEMTIRFDAGLPNPTNRNYRSGDLSVIAGLAAAAGYSAVLVFALYVSSDTALGRFSHPQILWLACPVLLFWISRMLLMSHRHLLHDDPIIFAVKDRVSWISGGVILVLEFLASSNFSL